MISPLNTTALTITVIKRSGVIFKPWPLFVFAKPNPIKTNDKDSNCYTHSFDPALVSFIRVQYVDEEPNGSDNAKHSKQYMFHQNDLGHAVLPSGFFLQALVQTIRINLEDRVSVIAAPFIKMTTLALPGLGPRFTSKEPTLST